MTGKSNTVLTPKLSASLRPSRPISAAAETLKASNAVGEGLSLLLVLLLGGKDNFL